MKIKELRELSFEELQKKLSDSKQELFNLRCQAKLGQIEKRANIRKVKKAIARIATLLNEEKSKVQSKGAQS
ncbi:MAG: 50S ribosomal protein L29 [Candidatus Aureabacteria bacterium]|nr:50S ribosomal protein L29 [Candidatus Auribacterota bacterium]